MSDSPATLGPRGRMGWLGGQLIEVETPLGFRVRCSDEYWEFISRVKHPSMSGKERAVMAALADPDQVRQSRADPSVLLFYRGCAPRWICAVARRLGDDGFLITAYPTDAIKAGELQWTRSG